MRDLYARLGAHTPQHPVGPRLPGARLRELRPRALDGETVRVPVAGPRVAAAITVGGAPRDDAQTYTVAGAAHILQDYLLGKEGVEILADDVQAPTVRDAAIAFLRGHAPLRNVTDGRLLNKI